jgi:uncharacterized membrane protein
MRDALKRIGNRIETGHSALFLLVREATSDKVMDWLGQFGSEILQTSLSSRDEEKLRAAFGAED